MISVNMLILSYKVRRCIQNWQWTLIFIYPCYHCEYAATLLSTLKKHKDSSHEEIKYPCDQCEYAATLLLTFKMHKESTEYSKIYPCDQCEYAATLLLTLKMHKESTEYSKIQISPVISVNMLLLSYQLWRSIKNYK